MRDKNYFWCWVYSFLVAGVGAWLSAAPATGKPSDTPATGQHLVFDRNTPLANLYMCMLDAFGAPVERFADSTGQLPGMIV